MTELTGNITLVLPPDTRVDSQSANLIARVNVMARACNLETVVRIGECVSPVSVSGDLSLSIAELIKQKALAYYGEWKAGIEC